MAIASVDEPFTPAPEPEMEEGPVVVESERGGGDDGMITTISRVVPPSARLAALSPFVVIRAVGGAVTASGTSLSLPAAVASVLAGMLLPVGGSHRRWIPFVRMGS